MLENSTSHQRSWNGLSSCPQSSFCVHCFHCLSLFTLEDGFTDLVAVASVAGAPDLLWSSSTESKPSITVSHVGVGRKFLLFHYEYQQKYLNKSIRLSSMEALTSKPWNKLDSCSGPVLNISNTNETLNLEGASMSILILLLHSRFAHVWSLCFGKRHG